MTFRSLVIEEHPDAASAQLPYNEGANNLRVGTLDAYTWRISAELFARTYNLATDYVDNSWVRVALPASLLRQFLQEGGASDHYCRRIVGQIDDGRWFVINEEEF